MKLIRMDSEYAWIYLIASIFIPPLFIMNLIILLCQAIPQAIKNKQEEKEMAEYNRISIQHKTSLYQPYIISENDKKIVNEKLNILKQSYLGATAEVISYFQLDLNNNILTKKDIYDFIDFLIGLYDVVPKEVLDLLPNANDLCTNEINTCIEILENNLD